MTSCEIESGRWTWVGQRTMKKKKKNKDDQRTPQNRERRSSERRTTHTHPRSETPHTETQTNPQTSSSHPPSAILDTSCRVTRGIILTAYPTNGQSFFVTFPRRERGGGEFSLMHFELFAPSVGSFGLLSVNFSPWLRHSILHSRISLRSPAKRTNHPRLPPHPLVRPP